jgi:hypothetical protein
MADNALQRIRTYDRTRPNISGEHWLALGGGVAMWLGTRRHPAFLVRLLGSIAGSVLVIRAVTGSAVPRPMARLLPFHRDDR